MVELHSSKSPHVRPAIDSDAASIADIYNHYIRESTATFEETPVSERDMLSRVQQVQQASLPWLVLEQEEQVIAYAYAKTWNARSAYRFTVETSIYVSSESAGKGVGKKLYDALFDRLRQMSLKQAIAIITLPNEPSVGFHEKMGMQQVAHLKQVGYKFGQWLDVGYWQGSL